jgi:hypothetical protein
MKVMILNNSKSMNWVSDKFIEFVHLAIVLLSSKIHENEVHGLQDRSSIPFMHLKKM